MLRFYGLRILKDYLGHIILIGLPLVLITLMTVINQQAAPEIEDAALHIAIIYILMFQLFGAAYTFEGLEFDFFRPFKDRLRASPVNPMNFVLANLGFSMITSLLQSLTLLVFVVIVFGAVVNNWGFIIFVLVLSVIFAQLLGAILILLLKKAGKAQAVITLYAIFGPVVAGFFFPLPETDFTIFLSKYSSPVAWTRLSINGFLSYDYTNAWLGIGLLSSVIVLAILLVYALSRRVII